MKVETQSLNTVRKQASQGVLINLILAAESELNCEELKVFLRAPYDSCLHDNGAELQWKSQLGASPN